MHFLWQVSLFLFSSKHTIGCHPCMFHAYTMYAMIQAYHLTCFKQVCTKTYMSYAVVHVSVMYVICMWNIPVTWHVSTPHITGMCNTWNITPIWSDLLWHAWHCAPKRCIIHDTGQLQACRPVFFQYGLPNDSTFKSCKKKCYTVQTASWFTVKFAEFPELPGNFEALWDLRTFDECSSNLKESLRKYAAELGRMRNS